MELNEEMLCKLKDVVARIIRIEYVEILLLLTVYVIFPLLYMYSTLSLSLYIYISYLL